MAVFRALLVVVFFVLGARGALAAPALWVVEGTHGKVYLFGTIHVLKPNQQWHTPALDAAIAESGDLWLEVPNADDPAAIGPIMGSLGVDSAHPLSSKLSRVDLARVDAAAKAMGAGGEAVFEPFRPWLVSVTLSMVPLLKAGYDPRLGVDAQLKSDFAGRGKPVRGFETMDQQLHFFADLPQAEEIAMLDATLDSIDTTAPSVDTLISAWSSGNLERLAAIQDEELFRRSPALFDQLVVRRNAAWALRLDARLRESGVSFVAVGAGHLAGASSLQAQLIKRGYRIRRVQ